MRDLDEGEELPDDVVAAYDEYLDAWRDWTTRYGPRVPLLALYERLFQIKQQADQLGERFETVVAAGLAMVPGGERGRIRRHLVTMRAEVHYEPQTGRINVRPAPDGMDVQFEDDMLDPALVPHKELREPAHAALVAAGTEIWAGATLVDALSVWTQAMRFDAVFDPRLDAPPMPSEGVLVALAPALILRKRTTRSLLAFYRKVDEQLEAGTLDPGLVAGLVAEPDGPSSTGAGSAAIDESDELFFPKPYNAEQLDVLRRLTTSDGVVVVGPPGHRQVAHHRQPRLAPPGHRAARAGHEPHEPRARGAPGQAARRDPLALGQPRWRRTGGDARAPAVCQRARQPLHGPGVGDAEDRPADRPVPATPRTRARGAASPPRRDPGGSRGRREGPRAGRGLVPRHPLPDRRGDRRRPGGLWLGDRTSGDAPALTDAEAAELAALATAITPEIEARCRVPIPDLPSGEAFAELCARITDLEAAVAGAAESRQLPSAAALAAATHDDRMALAAAIDRLQQARATATIAEPWELAAFEAALGGPVAKWRERQARTAEWIATLRETAATADGVVITGVARRGASRGKGRN